MQKSSELANMNSWGNIPELEIDKSLLQLSHFKHAFINYYEDLLSEKR